jgi:hypothetical protein
MGTLSVLGPDPELTPFGDGAVVTVPPHAKKKIALTKILRRFGTETPCFFSQADPDHGLKLLSGS